LLLAAYYRLLLLLLLLLLLCCFCAAGHGVDEMCLRVVPVLLVALLRARISVRGMPVLVAALMAIRRKKCVDTP
jgi:hypothetical protein